LTRRRIITGFLLLAGIGLLGWVYVQSLVPAIHPDHDHGLENIAGGGALRVETLDGPKRNLVGRPNRVLILHWFQLGQPTTREELPLLIDYARSVEEDDGVEIVLVAVGTPRGELREWAEGHGVPVAQLYADPRGKTAQLIGVRSTPETLIYDPEGHLVHQARGAIAWDDPGIRAAIASHKGGGGTAEHDHEH
jgi:hypothetical protein